jgi:hypothetical protein
MGVHVALSSQELVQDGPAHTDFPDLHLTQIPEVQAFAPSGVKVQVSPSPPPPHPIIIGPKNNINIAKNKHIFFIEKLRFKGWSHLINDLC